MKAVLFILGSLLFGIQCTAQTGFPVYSKLSTVTYHIGGVGTGFVVKLPSGKNVIITNWHVCTTSRNGKIIIQSEYRSYMTEAKIIVEDSAHDLCAIEDPIVEEGLSLAKDVHFLTPAYTGGYPGSASHIVHATGLVKLEETVNLKYPYPYGPCPTGFDPRLSLANEYCTLKITLQDTTIPIRPGCSGSAVINSRGDLIGVINSTNGYYGSMVPLRFVKTFIESIPEETNP